MATPASKVASQAKDQVSANMDKQLGGPLKTMHELEDKFSIVKQLHMTTYPPINAAKSVLDQMAMSDTTSGNPPGTAAALATIGVNEGLVQILRKMGDEYAGIKMKLLQPEEFAKTKLNGDLGFDTSDFTADGFYQDIRDGEYGIERDEDIVDQVDSELREEGTKFDFSIDEDEEFFERPNPEENQNLRLR